MKDSSKTIVDRFFPTNVSSMKASIDKKFQLAVSLKRIQKYFNSNKFMKNSLQNPNKP